MVCSVPAGMHCCDGGDGMKRNPSPVTDRQLPALNEYWQASNERKRMDDAAAHQRALTATIDAGMAPINAIQARSWADNGEV